MPDAIAGLAPTTTGLGLHGSVDGAMSALGGMDSEGFLKLLVAQLRYQSPLEPQDPGDLMTQTAALAQLDANQQLLQLQQRQFGLQQAVAASDLLGTEVGGITADGSRVEGVVDAVRFTAYGPVLSVGGVDLPYASLTELRGASTGSPVADASDTRDAPATWDGPLTADDDPNGPTTS